jgi:hypothetical protein
MIDHWLGQSKNGKCFARAKLKINKILGNDMPKTTEKMRRQNAIYKTRDSYVTC